MNGRKYIQVHLRGDITESSAYKSSKDGVKVVGIAFFLCRNPRASVRDAASFVSMSPSQALSVIRSLRDEGFVPKIVSCPGKDEMNAWIQKNRDRMKVSGDELRAFFSEMQTMTFIGSWQKYAESHLLAKDAGKKRAR